LQSSTDFYQQDLAHYLPVFNRLPPVISHGKGALLYDVEGNEYLDLVAGIAVNALGHANSELVEAQRKQLHQLTHISNAYLSIPQLELSIKLKELSGLDRVFFSNSGTESIEGAVKIARKYAVSKGKGSIVLSADGAFHGRSYAAIAMGKAAMQEGFGPMPSHFEKIPFNNLEAIKTRIEKNPNEIAAVVLEPIQGEGGIRPASIDYIRTLRKLCSEHDIALIFDEIQTGIGRTGKWFAKEHFNVQPDIMTLAKGLGGGVPIGAILCTEAVASALNKGDHGTTFGGNPFACATALAVIDIIEKNHLLKHVSTVGAWLIEELHRLNISSVKEIRGIGFMIGIEMDRPTRPLVFDFLDRGIMVNATAGNVIRIVPPLITTKEQFSHFITEFKQILKSLEANPINS
jgi:acetylornithine/N-succinyldiaminopimelate aminotransferase